ncbi:non-ribosomal peptide synthetase, partial [Chryseobacterium sp. BIGb0232]|uniref:non-ribosomal peptide synthetase n=1 Tax=Chryseobacterium sp. BIGb0232 TaxID=2940598 RepID=UPI002169E182
TETTVCATLHHYNEDENPVNIGGPIGNMTAYVLDNHHRIVPVGAIGELYVGGAGIARGYLNRLDLTEERFITNPFQTEDQKSKRENGRLYKTGDLVRWLSNGELEYIGRNDFQVKIRGYRIELGEIENQLLGYPGISQVAVLAKENTSGLKYLAGYYVSENEIDSSLLSEYLSESLPEYMVPSVFVHLLSLPLTINGKLDKKALPEPEFTGSKNYIAPETDLEKQLVAVYGEVLGINAETISIHDDFFRLGGNSIMAVKLISKIRQELDLQVNVGMVFNHKTVASLSYALAHENHNENGINIVPVKVNSPEEQRLSFAQERLWFIESYEGGSSAYNIPIITRLDDSIQLNLFEESLKTVIMRHDILRSMIHTTENGIGYQLVTDLVPEIKISEVNNESELEHAVNRCVNKVFSLDEETPVEINIFKLAGHAYLSIVVHHIAFDGWSIDVFLKEVASIYYSLSDGKEPELPPVKVQYKDFALWQREYLSGDRLENQIGYWKNKLDDFQNLELPSDFKRPSQISYEGENLYFNLNTEQGEKLRALSQKLGVSLYSVMLGGYYLMLSAYSGQDDIVVGSAIANRHHAGLEEIIGFFVNTLALREKVDPAQNISDFILQVSKSVNEAQSHQDLPFEKLVDELGVEQDTSRHPVFQVMFGLQSIDGDVKANKEEALFHPFTGEVDYKAAKFDLTTMIDDDGENIRIMFNYAKALFKEETIIRMAGSYQLLLDQMIDTNPDQTPIRNLSLISEEETQQIITEWNATQEDYSSEMTIHQLFEYQAEKNPDTIALVYNDVKLSYRELNERSNRLANHLIHQYQIQPDDLVPLCLERSENMLIAILAVLKAGAAYVPMDPSYPADRIGHILEDTQAKLVIAQESTIDKLQNINLISLDEVTLKATLETEVTNNPVTEVYSGNLAYVIYTSGTTGLPKGVMIEHKGVINLIRSMIKAHQLDEYQEVGCYSNYVFDAFVYEAFPVLCNGNSLWLYNNELRTSVNELNDYIKTNAIEVSFIPPVLLREIVENGTGLKLIFAGGESFPALDKNIENITLVNEYGPTEGTVCVTLHDYKEDKNPLNIGGAIANTTLYVLDAQYRPVPVGAVGELFIGGAGIARGYLNRPELTEERFMVNPFQTSEQKEKDENSRLYRTGDLVRWLPNGELEYRGRNDFQVKIRGHRIELGEIENTLLQLEGIRQTAVLARENKSGVKYLAAYYVSDSAMDADQLSEYASESLPEYMVPGAFVHLAELPLTINGKLDRRALPEPEFTGGKDYVAAETELQSQLCQIYGDVLGLDPDTISIHDDFFRLGGDSIISIQLVGKIRQQLEVRISVKEVFTARTVASLSQLIEDKKHGSEANILTEQGILTGEVPLLPVQEWFFEQKESGYLTAFNHWNQAFIINVPKLDKNLFEQAIDLLLTKHDAFRLGYTGHTQEYKSGENAPEINYLDASDLKPEELADIFTDWQSHFDIENGSLYQIGYVDGYQDGSARIFFAFHHLIIDAVSWRILTEDLKNIYQTLEKGENYQVQKGSSYRQWVEAIRSYKKETPESRDQETTYWNHIADIVEESNSTLSKLITGEYQHGHLQLDKESTGTLIRGIHHVYHTQINDLLLSALAQALTKVTGDKCHAILLEGHGREEVFSQLDITETMGWFTTMYPVQLESGKSSKDTVILTKESLRSIPNNGIGYGSLVGYTNRGLPKISFNYLGQLDKEDVSGEKTWFIAAEDTGAGVGASNRDSHFVSINGAVVDGQLRFGISGYLSAENITLLSESFKQNLESIIKNLSEENRSYLTGSDVDHVVEKTQLSAIQEKGEIEGVYLANSLQEGFVYHALNQGETDDAYRVQLMWEYRAKINTEKLKNSWKLTQAQYPTLRVRFDWNGEIVQVIDKKGELDWRYQDISALSEEEQEKLIKEITHNDRFEGYDLTKGNLFRVYLFKRNEEYYSCLFSNHHAILDGWSMPVMMNSVHEAYLSQVNNEEYVLSIDQAYAASQKYLQVNKKAGRSFWDQYMTLLEDQEDLKSLVKEDQRQIDLGTYRHIRDHQKVTMLINGDRYHHLKDFTKAHGLTVNAVLQYLWHSQLKLYSGLQTTVVGTTVSGRSLPVDGIESSAGLYINTLPLIVNHEDSRVIDRIMEIQNRISDLNTHSDINLAELHHDGRRIFSSLFVYENYPVPKGEGSNELGFIFKDSVEKLDYPLGIMASEQGESVLLKLNYEGALFENKTMKQLMDGMEIILNQILDNPEMTSDALSYISESQWEQMLTWNDTQLSYPSDKTIHSLFEDQVLKTPDNIALVYEDVKLSYHELNERSNRLANYLIKVYDIQPDDLIPLCLERSENMLIGVLAVLKAGAAYVPMDTSYPAERIEYILSDTKAKIMLAQESTAEKLQGMNVDVISLDNTSFKQIIEKENASNPVTAIKPDNLAYVIYTSGTTGHPKGVMVEHTSVVNRIVWMNDTYPLVPTDNILQKTPYTFDVSVWELFWAHFYGACIVFARPEGHKDPEYLAEVIQKTDVTILHFVPSMLSAFEETLDTKEELQAMVKSLRYIFCSGEALPLKQVQDARRLMSHAEIHNLYGPTEATVDVLYYDCNDPAIQNVLIGQPIANTAVYVLDKFLHPVPIGGVGELYIGGVGVARGYLNRPELTEERFIANPFHTDKEKDEEYNGTLYKTGDLVRWVSGGNIEYLGRNDFQVKVRGFRIELGEIENALVKYSDIRQVAVLAKENNAGVKYLVAYYVSDNELNDEQLTEFLSATLPEYMVPNIFVHLKALPVTLNGKLDRKQLPEPELKGSHEYTAPENELQEKLCKVYGEVLGIEAETISINDDFFRLGGNSIMAIKLISKIRLVLEMQANVAMIFNHKTVASLSAALMENIQEDQITILPSQVDSLEDQRLSFAQERLWFIESYEGGSSAYNIPMTVTLSRKTDIPALHRALETVIQRHEVLRTFILTTENGVGYQVVTDLLPEIRTIEAGNREELEELVNRSAHKVFRLEEEIPVAVNIFKLDNISYLSVVIHHIAFDGWSTDIFLKEVAEAYHAIAGGKQPELPELNIQYKDFALWQRNYLTGERLDNQINYWKTKLDDYQSLDLPVDFHRPAEISYDGDTARFNIPEAMALGLKDISRNLGVSLYNVMLSGYYLTLSTYSGQEDIIVGSPIANRHYAGLEDLIGFFVNTLALREKIDPQQNIKDFILQVSKSVTEAQAHQDLPFEKLVEELGVEQDTSRHPVFQVMFGLQTSNAGGVAAQEEEVIFQPFDGDVDYQAAKFDLTTMINESPEGIQMSFNYATSLFKKETITRIANTYQHLLGQIVQIEKSNTDHLKIGELSLLSETENRQITEIWNDNRKAYQDKATIHQQFEYQAAKTPDDMALVYQDVKLSYNELNERANQLSNYLIKEYKLQPDDLVPLCLERSEDMLVAILAILKAGAAYVPMDPSYPADRISHILKDTGAEVILIHEEVKDKFSEVSLEVNLVLLNDKALIEELSTAETHNPVSRVKSDNLAYVIYTSGTTGLPKGVMIEHKGVINLIDAMTEVHQLEKYKNVGVYSNYVFDAFVYEVFPSLCNGNTLWLYSNELRTSVNELNDYIKTNTIEVSFIPPVLLREVVDNGTSLQLIHAGGESFPALNKNIENITLINEYGPTEGTVCATLHDYKEDQNPLNIGKAIANTTLYVLDAQYRPVPDGAVGELYIGGAGVARGYLNRPELTEERFMVNPFQTADQKGKDENSRLYRTGDLVRRLANGELEYMGRNDFQVKIRGHRIELGEIENTLLQYPGIRQAAVLVKEDKGNMKYLVGYYVSNPVIDPLQLSEFLLKSLPEYMIPNVFVHLTALPLTINGKLDRRQLPEPEFTGVSEYAAPENELQRQIAVIYGEVLGLDAESISIHDDFFRVGGNSIMAIKLISRIQLVLDVKVKIVDVFKERTISKLAALITKFGKEYRTVSILNAVNNNPNIFFIHPGNGGSEVYQSLAEQLKTSYDCYGVDSYNLYHEEKIDNLNKLAGYYLDHIIQIQEETQQEEYILLGWSLGGTIALEIASQLEKRGCKKIKVYLLDTIFYASDQKLVNFLSFPSDEELSSKLEVPVDHSHFIATKSFMSAEFTIAREHISNSLGFTKVVLLKAMLGGEGFDESFNNYMMNCTYNNVDSVIENQELLSVYPVEAAHQFMLEKEEQIIDIINKTVGK